MSQYLRELVRRDQDAEASHRLRTLIAESLASGEARELTDEIIAELRDRAFAHDR